jgi:hypothetical protein
MTTLITAYTMGGLITFGAEILSKISNDVEAGLLPVSIVTSNYAKMQQKLPLFGLLLLCG